MSSSGLPRVQRGWLKHVPLFFALVIGVYLYVNVVSPGSRQLAQHLLESPLQWLVVLLGVSLIVQGVSSVKSRRSTYGHPLAGRIFREIDSLNFYLQQYAVYFQPEYFTYAKEELEKVGRTGELIVKLKKEDERKSGEAPFRRQFQ